MRLSLGLTLTLLLTTSRARPDDLGEALDDLRVQVLVATLRDEGDEVKDAAAVVLATLGEAGIPALLRGLDSDDPATRIRCVTALRDVTGFPATALPRLIGALRRAKDDTERLEVAVTLALFGNVAHEHVALYSNAASGSSDMPRRLAYLGLARMGPTDETIPIMIDGLVDSDPEIQSIAAAVLAPRDRSSMPDRWRFGSRIDDPAPWWRFWSDPGLSGYRSRVLDRLVPLVRHADSDLRVLAANGLGRTAEPLSQRALWALRNALEDNDEDVRWAAAAALAQLGERGLVPQAILLSMLESNDNNQQYAAARVAWRLGSRAAWAAASLRRTWDAAASLDSKVAAAAALGRLGDATDEMVGQIAAAYAAVDPWDTNRFVRNRREELAEWLCASRGVYSVLVAAATGKRRIIIDYWHGRLDQQDAVRALEPFPERAGETIAVLRRLLDEADSWDVRFRAAELLHRLGVAKDAYERQLGELIDTGQDYSLVVATELLLRASPGSQRPVPRLVHALSETSIVIGGQPFEMAQLLAKIDHLPPTAKMPLLRAARSNEARLRSEAVGALGHLTNPDEEVRNFLWASLEDTGSDARGAAAESLARIVRSPTDIERLVVGARGLRSRSFDILAADPTRAPAAFEVLARMAKDDANLPHIVDALDAIAPRSEVTRAVHLRLVQEGGAPARLPTEQGDRAFLAPLVRQLLVRRSGQRDRRPTAAAVLPKLANAVELTRLVAAVEDLISLPATRARALVALGDMGPRAAAAIPAIRELEKDAQLGNLARLTRTRIRH